jgi:hypothetical protein
VAKIQSARRVVKRSVSRKVRGHRIVNQEMDLKQAAGIKKRLFRSASCRAWRDGRDEPPRNRPEKFSAAVLTGPAWDARPAIDPVARPSLLLLRAKYGIIGIWATAAIHR